MARYHIPANNRLGDNPTLAALLERFNPNPESKEIDANNLTQQAVKIKKHGHGYQLSKGCTFSNLDSIGAEKIMATVQQGFVERWQTDYPKQNAEERFAGVLAKATQAEVEPTLYGLLHVLMAREGAFIITPPDASQRFKTGAHYLKQFVNGKCEEAVVMKRYQHIIREARQDEHSPEKRVLAACLTHAINTHVDFSRGNSR